MLDTSLRQPPATSHQPLSITKTKAKPLQKISNSFTLNHENAESKLDNLHLYPHIRMSSTCTIKDRLAMANLVKEFDRDQLDGFKLGCHTEESGAFVARNEGRYCDAEIQERHGQCNYNQFNPTEPRCTNRLLPTQCVYNQWHPTLTRCTNRVFPTPIPSAPTRSSKRKNTAQTVYQFGNTHPSAGTTQSC